MAIEDFGYKQELKRSLSLTDLVIYGMIFMIPIAPFGVYGYVNSEAPGMVPLAYIIGMVAMLFTALSYGSMARAFPIAGSVYSYAQRGLHPNAGFIAGWLLLLDYLLIPPLLYIYAAIALNHLYPAIPKTGFILAFLISATLVNLRGMTFTARMNILFLLAQLIVLGIFLACGWNALHTGAGNGHLTLSPLYNPAAFSFPLMMQAVSIAVLSFLGFDAISTLAEETKGDAGRSVGRAALISLLVMGGIFVAQTWLATDLAAGMGFTSADSAFYEIAEIAGGSWLAPPPGTGPDAARHRAGLGSCCLHYLSSRGFAIAVRDGSGWETSQDFGQSTSEIQYALCEYLYGRRTVDGHLLFFHRHRRHADIVS